MLPPLSTRVQEAFSRADADVLLLNCGEALVETQRGTGDVHCRTDADANNRRTFAPLDTEQ